MPASLLKAPRLIPVIITPAMPPEIAELALNASEKIKSKEGMNDSKFKRIAISTAIK